MRRDRFLERVEGELPPRPPFQPQVTDGKQALLLLGLDRTTFWSRVARGKIPTRFVFRTGPRSWFFDLERFIEWLRAGRPSLPEVEAPAAVAPLNGNGEAARA
jgi:hypothetical protein